MGIPWLLALKAIPWGTILTNAPAILRSADALALRTRRRPDPAAIKDVQALADRIAMLEQRDNETAELLTRVTAQVESQANATQGGDLAGAFLILPLIATPAVDEQHARDQGPRHDQRAEDVLALDSQINRLIACRHTVGRR